MTTPVSDATSEATLLLSSWVNGAHGNALRRLAALTDAQAVAEEIARRLAFAVRATALLLGRSVPEQWADFESRLSYLYRDPAGRRPKNKGAQAKPAAT